MNGAQTMMKTATMRRRITCFFFTKVVPNTFPAFTFVIMWQCNTSQLWKRFALDSASGMIEGHESHHSLCKACDVEF